MVKIVHLPTGIFKPSHLFELAEVVIQLACFHWNTRRSLSVFTEVRCCKISIAFTERGTVLECPFLVIGKKAVRFSKLILFQVKLAISPALIAVSIAKRNAAPCNFVRFLAVQYVRHINLTQKSDAQFHVHYIDEFLVLVLLVSQDILGGFCYKIPFNRFGH